ncbi:glycosyltransferase [Cryobacterium zongtaii]|nr:glycosyltransferase [Cryobacterium zongtaii]
MIGGQSRSHEIAKAKEELGSRITNRQGNVTAQPKTTTVLQALGKLDEKSNPYLWQMVGSLPSDLVVRYFTWRTALFGRYDIIHVHWPDAMMRGATPGTSLAKRILTGALLTRIAITRTSVVQTLHNTRPHESTQSRFEGLLLKRLNKMTSIAVALNARTPQLSPVIPQVTIPHGHYIHWFENFAKEEPRLGQMLFFGLIRKYKGVDRLVHQFAALTDQSLRLVVRGAVTDSNLRDSLVAAAARDSRVFLGFGHLSDGDLTHEITSSELVVLPYTQLHNSGAVILALSLGRPVLVPELPETLDIQQEVGPEWVLLYSGDLEAEDIQSALAQVRAATPRDVAPDLSRRDWSDAGTQLAKAYSLALTRPRHR